MFNFIKIYILLMIIFFNGFAIAQEIQSSFNVDVQLFDPNGVNPLEDPNISLRIQILNPTKTCVLYDENRTGISTVDTKGYLSVQVGSLIGSPRRTVGSDIGNDFKKIFLNTSPINGSGNNCSGNIYIPSVNDIRYLRILVSSSTFSNSLLEPDILLSSSPIAVNSSQLNGKSENDFVQINSSVTQTNANLLLPNTNALITLLNNSTNFLTSASLSNYVTQSSLTTQLNSKQNNLGFTPLNPANNLSELSNQTTARTNLGLGSSAVRNSPSSGNAGTTEVVLGNDTRLSDSRPPTAHTHTLSQITDAGQLAALNTVPNNKTTGTSSSTPDTLVLRDANGNFESSNIYSNNNLYIGNSSDADITISNVDTPLANPYGLNAGSIIRQKYGKGNFAIKTQDNNDNDANPTDNLVIETGGKFAGTGDSGSMLFSPGPSAGGVRGEVYFNSNVIPTEDNFYQLGTNQDRWGGIWGGFVSASDSMGLRDPNDATPVLTMSVFNNGTNTGPFIRGPFKSGQYSGFGIMGRDNNGNNSFTTEHLWLTTANKMNGTGGTGIIIIQPGFALNGGQRGNILLNGVIDINGNRMMNLPNPSAANDAANKNYVDSVVTSSHNSLATVATTGNYNDLTNKPTLGSISSLSSVSDVNINNLDYGKLFNVPLSFNPSAHTHNISDIINLSTSLSGKLDVSFFNTAVSNANCSSSQTAYWNSVLSQISCQNISFSADPVNKIDPSNKNYVDTYGGARFFTSAGTTTTLAVSDSRDTIITGSATHTFVLPTTANLQIGNWWRFVNRSSQSVTVQTSALATIAVVPSQTVYHVRVLSTSSESFAAYGQAIFSSADGSTNFNSGKGINLATPTNSTDAANKGYVDSLVSSANNLGAINQDLIFVDSSSNSSAGTRIIGTASPTAPADLNASDNLLIQTGPSTFGSTGNITIKTSQATNQNWGNGTVKSGSFIISVGGGSFPIAPGTLKIQDSSNGNGTTGIVGNVWTQTASDGSGSWQAPTISNVVKSIGMTNPKICSFFVSNGTGVETQCTSAGCTTQNINGGCATIGSVTRTSVGKYAYTFPVGYWANGAQVNCTANFSVCGAGSGICFERVSNSLLSSSRAIEFYDSTNTPQDASFSVICHGE